MVKKTPTFKWAERTDKVYVTIEVEDVCGTPSIAIKAEGDHPELTFDGAGGTNKEEYELRVPLFKAIDEENSKWAVGARGIVFILAKKEPEYWERLLPPGVKMNNCKVDWDKWKDEDDDQTDADMGGMDFSGMGGMGGMGGMDMQQMMAGMGGMGGFEGGEDDSDDEEDMPPLEGAEGEPEEGKPEEGAAADGEPKEEDSKAEGA